jgi:hypothetical protein
MHLYDTAGCPRASDAYMASDMLPPCGPLHAMPRPFVYDTLDCSRMLAVDIVYVPTLLNGKGADLVQIGMGSWVASPGEPPGLELHGASSVAGTVWGLRLLLTAIHDGCACACRPGGCHHQDTCGAQHRGVIDAWRDLRG